MHLKLYLKRVISYSLSELSTHFPEIISEEYKKLKNGKVFLQLSEPIG